MVELEQRLLLADLTSTTPVVSTTDIRPGVGMGEGVGTTGDAGAAISLTITSRDKSDDVATDDTLPCQVAAGATVLVAPTVAGSLTSVATTNDAIPAGAAGSITMASAAATQFFITTTAAEPQEAGAPFQLTATALDDFGNVATDFNGPILVTSADPQAVLPTGVTLVNGSATFAVTLKTAGTIGVTVADPAGVVPSTTSSTIVAPGSVAFLQVTGPIIIGVGQPALDTVTAFDAFGNAATNSDDTIQVTGSDPGVSVPPPLGLSRGSAQFFVTYTTVGPHAITVARSTDPTVATTQAAAATTTVSGIIFIDLSGTGVRSADDPVLADRNVYIDLNGNGRLDSDEPTAVTDASGRYTIPGVTVAAPTVRQALDRDPSLRDSRSVSRANADGSIDLAVTVLAAVAPVAATPGLLPAAPNSDPTTAYVAALYRSVLGRSGSAEEVALWPRLIAGLGLDRAGIASLFVNSTEHRRQQVESDYERFLGRTPDPTAEFWVDALQRGVTEAQVARSILASPEYRVGKTSIGGAIASFYDDVLGRQIDDGPPVFYPTVVPDADFFATEAAIFVDSPEAHDQVVASFYASYLHRQREGGATSASWTNLLDSGSGSATDVAVGILASDEFLANARAGRS